MASQASKTVLIASTGEVGAIGWASSGLPTRKLHGITDASLTITEQAEAMPNVGWYGPGPVLEETQQAGEFSLEGIWTYQEAPKILNGLFTYTSQSTAAAAPYDYHWPAPVASTQICATYPTEWSLSTGQVYRAEGCVFNGITLTGEAGSYWKYTVPGVCRVVAPVTTGYSTAAWQDNRTMTPVAMKDTQIRINPFTTGLFGSSSGVVSAVLISFELGVSMNRHTKLFAGNSRPGGWGDNKIEGTLKTVLEFDSNSKALLDEMIGTSSGGGSSGVALQRQITLWATATSTVGTSGYVSAINFAGMQNQPIQLWGDRDGNCTVEFNWQGKFTTALQDIGTSGTGNWLTFQVTNSSCSTT